MTTQAVSERRRNRCRALLSSRSWHELRRWLVRLHPADVAEVLDAFNEDEETVLFRLGPQRRRVRVSRARAAAAHPPQRHRSAESWPACVPTTGRGSSRSCRAGRPRAPRPPPPVRDEGSLVLLGYPENTAGRYMTPQVRRPAADMTAARGPGAHPPDGPRQGDAQHPLHRRRATASWSRTCGSARWCWPTPTPR